MKLQSFIIWVLLLTSSLAFGQVIVEVNGMIKGFGYYEVDSKDTLSEPSRTQLYERLELYKNKKDVMTEFVKALEPNRDYALKLKKKDKVLKKERTDVILITYHLGRLRDFKMLFNPKIRIIDSLNNNIYIRCSASQLQQLYDQLKDAYDKETYMKFRCTLLGDFYLDNIKLYELVEL